MSDRMGDGQKGKVWLVGAGPGDAGLLTVKGAKALANAQTVVYDALVGEGVLGKIPESAKQIYVGKRGGNHAKTQDEINYILVDAAENGNRVVRLKGGDPFVFGRGSEEAKVLREQKIPFEIIPGVTSAVSVPAYCGIPVTHRGIATSFHVITGHFKNGEPVILDFEAFVRTEGTLIFLMGLSSAKEICEGLLNAGMSADMPAALLQEGTTARQKKVISTLEKLIEDGRNAGIKAPAIIVVGEVCNLEEVCRWAEDRPLFGKRVLVTRPRRRAGRMAELLEESGAEAIEFPVIETRLVEEQKAIENAVLNINKFDWLAFTSPSGVEHLLEYLKVNRLDIRILGDVKIAVIGRATGDSLQKAGIYYDYMPERFYAADLGEGLAKKMEKSEKLLILRAREASPKLLKPLNEAGICYEDNPLYETLYPSDNPAAFRIKEMLKAGEFDFVTFTSASTVKGFLKIFSEEEEILNCFVAVCIGEETAGIVKKYGMNYLVSEIPDMESMIKRMSGQT